MAEQRDIDTLDFARKSLEIHGTIAVLDFSRLGDVLASTDGELHYRLSGGRGPQGESELTLELRASLNLVCQRCLGAMQYVLETTSRFVIVADESLLPAPEDEREDADYMVAESRMNLMALIEDEVLLSLPLAPLHENEACNQAMAAVKEQKESPFKVLQGLKLNKD